MPDASNWIGAVSGVIAAVVGVATLLTVYVAAAHIYSRRQIYQLGLSEKSLGQWRKTVVKRSWHRLRTDIRTPTITVASLLKEKWEPRLGLVQSRMEFAKFHCNKPGQLQRSNSFFDMRPRFPGDESQELLADEMVIVETSWVNLLSALGIEPVQDVKCQFYELQVEQELVNGMVPMRWKGRDLVAVASMLGFQYEYSGHKKRHNGHTPMPLPMLWGGPLGWLQLRASSEGCIAEFRMREISTMSLQLGLINDQPQLSDDEPHSHRYHAKVNNDMIAEMNPKEPGGAELVLVPQYALLRRLWQSIGGFVLAKLSKDKHTLVTLYLGGMDSGKSKGRRNGLLRTDELCEEAMAQPDGATEDDMRHLTYGNEPGEWPDEIRDPGGLSQVLPSDRQDAPKSKQGSTKMLEVLVECPGLLHTVAEGTWAETRGLDWHENILEYHRIYMKRLELRSSKKYARTHKYEMGDLCMDIKLLGYIKSGLRLLKPDLFYFCPSGIMSCDLTEIFEHIKNSLEQIQVPYIFPKKAMQRLKEEKNKLTPQQLDVYHAMLIANEIQRLHDIGREHLAIQDIHYITIACARLSKALEASTSVSLQQTQQNPQSGTETGVPSQDSQTLGEFKHTVGTDLEWALLYSPNLFEDLLRRLQHAEFELLKLMQDQSQKIVLRDQPRNSVAARDEPILEGIEDILEGEDSIDPELAGMSQAPKDQVSVEIDCSSITKPQPLPEGETNRKPWPEYRLTGKYVVPLVAEKIYAKETKAEEIDIDGTTVLAAFVNVILVYFWQQKRWVTNVSVFDTSIPQSVTMI